MATPTISTCDLCDRFRDSASDDFRVLPGVFRSYGGRMAFHGPVRTLRCHEANAKLRELLQTPGDGRVIVVDGGASMQRALLGGNLAGFAAQHGWAGVLINGVVRDLAELRAADVGIFALGHCPMPSYKREEGSLDEPVRIQGTWIRPGDWLYADEDGIVVSSTAL
ncbi:ribonuclease E activity regulator RraA [Ideonella sp. DXS29W]|uniref:4-hydroxy-4-methyl-2-oxoglutarate aldolase n=1 Tax=Ideonella lacteola TaxID=2984193 RepID=A0ABU9C106_9BURK